MMKKSQALAALALAFALGVVAPIASASAFEVKTQNNSTDTATGKATCKELNTAIAAIKNDTNYSTIKAISEANEKFGNGEYADIKVNSFNGLKTLVGAYASAFFTDTEVYNAVVSNAANATPLTNANIEETQSLLNVAVNSDTYYAYFVNLIDAIEDTTSNKYNKLYTAVQEFKANVPATTHTNLPAFNPNTLLKDYANVSVINNAYGSGVAKYYQDIKGAVKTVQDQLDKAVAGKDAYVKILSQSGLLTTAPAVKNGASLFANYNKDTNATVVRNLHDLANQANGYLTINSNWYDLYNTIEKLTACTDRSDEWTNFNTLWSLARTYKAAVNRTSTNTKTIAEELIAYTGQGTQQPTDPSNPSDDDNKGDDDNKTPTTPGTGIVSTAEGSASTTISIVAGLATALTALGAGVVAYRNARRSGEK